MADAIDSAKNPRIKLMRSLAQKKFRDETGLFLAEGDKLLCEALEWGFKTEFALFEDAECSLARRLKDDGAEVFQASKAAMKAACDTDTPQGAAAAVRIPAAGAKPEKGLWVVLDGVQDPGNLGAILRCTDAFGATGALLGPGCADAWSPKAVRAAMGSSFHIPVVTSGDLTETLFGMKKAGFTVVAAHLAGAPALPEKLGGSVALLIGNEGRGLSKDVADTADICYRLPMKGRAESLNAAVAAGVILYELSSRMD